MKKIFFSFVALAALAACTKSEVAYDDTPQEIGFVAVANNITKAPVSGEVFPTDLNLYVNSYVHQTTPPTAPDYIANGEFKHKSDNTWSGIKPYYWPNEKTLHFSGFSKSGNFAALNAQPTASTNPSASYNPSTDVLTITNYTPGTGFATKDGATVTVANDLMWFPSTKNTVGKESGYGKGAEPVTAKMYHTCAWITFLVQGNAVTGGENSTYTITSLTMNGVDMTADLECKGTISTTKEVDGESITSTKNVSDDGSDLSEFIKWSKINQNTEGESYNVQVYKSADGNSSAVELKNTYNKPKNLETGAETTVSDVQTTYPTTGGNIVVIPQKPGSINLAWTYKSTTNADISDSATGLSLQLTTDADDVNNVWEPGKHYVYTITVTASEILISPTPVEWVNGDMTGNGGVTVE